MCTSNATWFRRAGFEKTNYSPCSPVSLLQLRTVVHISAYAISTAALLPALIIFYSYKQVASPPPLPHSLPTPSPLPGSRLGCRDNLATLDPIKLGCKVWNCPLQSALVSRWLPVDIHWISAAQLPPCLIIDRLDWFVTCLHSRLLAWWRRLGHECLSIRKVDAGRATPSGGKATIGAR